MGYTLAQGLAGMAQQIGQRLLRRNGLGGIFTVPVHAIPLALWRAAASAMEAAYIPARHGWSLAVLPSALGSRCAARAAVARKRTVHGVDPEFPGPPRPMPVTLPTMAWPPSFTVTCSTRMVWSPLDL
jgi:hypothetical protein